MQFVEPNSRNQIESAAIGNILVEMSPGLGTEELAALAALMSYSARGEQGMPWYTQALRVLYKSSEPIVESPTKPAFFKFGVIPKRK